MRYPFGHGLSYTSFEYSDLTVDEGGIEFTIKGVSDDEYRTILSREIPDGTWIGEVGKNNAIYQLYYVKSPVVRLVYKILSSLKDKVKANGIS